jgi:hypothetical protein
MEAEAQRLPPAQRTQRHAGRRVRIRGRLRGRPRLHAGRGRHESGNSKGTKNNHSQESWV